MMMGFLKFFNPGIIKRRRGRQVKEIGYPLSACH
jgi:hypothetical protein